MYRNIALPVNFWQNLYNFQESGTTNFHLLKEQSFDTGILTKYHKVILKKQLSYYSQFTLILNIYRITS